MVTIKEFKRTASPEQIKVIDRLAELHKEGLAVRDAYQEVAEEIQEKLQNAQAVLAKRMAEVQGQQAVKKSAKATKKVGKSKLSDEEREKRLSARAQKAWETRRRMAEEAAASNS